MFGSLMVHRMIIFMNLFEIAVSLRDVPKYLIDDLSALDIHFQTMAPICF